MCAYRDLPPAETMDYGYPQILSIDVLRTYINLGTIRSLDGDPQETGQLTSQITGAIDWRREGIRHRKNEVGERFRCALFLPRVLGHRAE